MYILRCSDSSYYVGSTWDLERRLAQHQRGEGAAYTRRRRPVELVFAEDYVRIEDAFAREKQVQNWGRAKREALINGDQNALRRLSRGTDRCPE
jgi:predicted GIY-YIG superfamily endonuclease